MIFDALSEHPEGLDIKEIRELLPIGPDEHQHLDRRVRDLDPYYVIERRRRGRRTVYVLRGLRPKGEWDYDVISKDLRAKILLEADGGCQMCGRTIKQDRIRLHVDHKVPRSQGGPTVAENLWAVCSACNEGMGDKST